MSGEQLRERPYHSPLYARERLVSLPTLDVSVIGTLHGYLGEEFKGRVQTETDLAEEYGVSPAHALVLDAIMPLESHQGTEVIQKALVQPYSDREPTFYEWGVQYSVEKDTAIIAADPVSNNTEYLQICSVEFDNAVRAMSEAYPSRPVADVSVPGVLLLANAIRKNTSVSRRELLGMIGVAPLTLDSATIPLPSPDDIRIVNAMLDHPGEITDEDRATLPMQRFAQMIKDYFPLSVVLRNAVIADVLAHYGGMLQEQNKEKERIAVVMGSYHIAVPEDVSISYLLTHHDERQVLIGTLLDKMFTGISAGDYDSDEGKIDSSSITQTLQSFAKKYIVADDGTVTAESLRSPAIETWFTVQNSIHA